MAGELPEYYFRVREQGAAVYRVETDNPERRLELNQIAVVNTKRGDWKPQGATELTAADEAAIADWLAHRQAVLAERRLDDIHRAVDHLNLTAAWAQSQATDAELEGVTDTLLLAMHDLRTVLIRRKADRIDRADGADG
ncbi:hypothetical protein [Ovoidimarina sediminis]|uniref:hypothetical protein n=1 Tax=Ovoidimarina sediminis TaxID=3079856 RepID=UPI00290F7219|nr:hypothetical protein [Rhodophyticola sp. MJ-SS7]MDU8943699.1 hypothetical protein [Rhodophyticola sp. MJ-SS7]